MFGGQALGGIFTALTEICSLWIGASPVFSGLVYFIIGDAMLLLSLIAYIILERAVSLLFIISGLTQYHIILHFNPSVCDKNEIISKSRL